MARTKKNLSQKEKELLTIISDAKKKLSNLQNKQKMEIGELAYKHGLNQIDLNILDNAFKQIAINLVE